MSSENIPFVRWFEQALRLYRDHFLLLMLAHMTWLGVSVFSLGILSGPLLVGIARIELDLLTHREAQPEPGDVFLGLKSFLPALLLAAGIALVSFLLAAILVATRLDWLKWLAPVLPLTATFATLHEIAQGEQDLGRAWQIGWATVRPVFWPMAGLMAIAWTIGLMGALFLRVGIAVTMPFFTCLMTVAYRELSQASESNI